MKRQILISDLTRFEPADTISRDGSPGTWMVVDYEMEEGKGAMLIGPPGVPIPDLRLKLNVEGWYEIRLGIFYSGPAGPRGSGALRARLSDDPAFSHFCQEDFRPSKDGHYPEKGLRWWDVAETLWKCADLMGQDLIISRPQGGDMAELYTHLTYVRLVEMDRVGVGAFDAEKPSPETRTMVGYQVGFYHQWGLSSREDFREAFEHFRDSDFDFVLHRIASGSQTLYPSKVGDLAPPHDVWTSLLNECVERGVDPLEEAMKAAKACGVRLFGQNRLLGATIPPHHLPRNYSGNLIADHPEWRCTYSDGEPIRHLSFAFEGVRRFHLRLIREWVEDYGMDGICIPFNRSFPFVYYEKPVCERFRREHGEDMRCLSPCDDRVTQVRSDFLTQFLREVRSTLDEVGKAQGRYIPTCYPVPVSVPHPCEPEGETAFSSCERHAVDVHTWVREGLVDYLLLHMEITGKHDGTGAAPVIGSFADLTRGTKTEVVADIYPRRMPPRQYRLIAMNYYAAGADRLSIFDTHYRYYRMSEWAFVKHLGHRAELPEWNGKGDDYYKAVPFKSLDGYRMEREYSEPTDG